MSRKSFRERQSPVELRRRGVRGRGDRGRNLGCDPSKMYRLGEHVTRWCALVIEPPYYVREKVRKTRPRE